MADSLSHPDCVRGNRLIRRALGVLQAALAKGLAAVFERLAHGTHKQTPGGRHVYRIGREDDQTVAIHLLKTRPGIGEIDPHRHPKARLKRGEVEFKVTQQLLTHGTQQLFVGVATQATGQRQLTDRQLLLIALQVTDVVHMQVVNLTAGSQTKTEMITRTMTTETLAVVVQLAIFLSHRQFIVRQGELAQADIAVAGR